MITFTGGQIVEDNNQQIPKRSSRVAEKQKKSKKKGRILIKPFFATILLIMILCFSATAGYKVMSNHQDKQPVDITTLPPEDQQAAKDKKALNNINLLLVGCDERFANEKARADTIMVAILRPDDKEVSLLSVPRDTRVAIPGRKYKDKINHALAFGDLPLLQETVENLLDIKIDYSVKINFDGFVNVINALGGVTIDVERRMYRPSENIDLQKGLQTLNGKDALAYVRWRGDGLGDLGRIERQQKFLTALAEEVKDMSLTEALSVAGAVMNSIETDMSVATMTRYGVKFLGIHPSDIETHSLPGEPAMINGVSYMEPNIKGLAEVMELMKFGKPEEVPVEEPASETQEPALTE